MTKLFDYLDTIPEEYIFLGAIVLVIILIWLRYIFDKDYKDTFFGR